MDWKETRGRSEGYELNSGHIRVTIHKHIHFDGWRLSCVPSKIADNHGLEADTPEEAKVEAVEHVRAWLRSNLEQLPEPNH